MVIVGFFVSETYAINAFQEGTRQNFLHPEYFGVLYRTNRHTNIPPPPGPWPNTAVDSLMYPSRGGSGAIKNGRGVQWKNAFTLLVFIACYRIYTSLDQK